MIASPEDPSPDDPYQRAAERLLAHLPKDRILAFYAQAGGQELLSGKFANPASSACLAANAFGAFVDRPEAFSLPSALIAKGDARLVALESEMRFPWRGGRHPWLDAHIETADRLIGIESKRYEPFRDQKVVNFSEAYAREVWGDQMRPFEAMRAALEDGSERFRFLDATQLVKHAFGLRTQGDKRSLQPHLLYLYAEPAILSQGSPLLDKDKHAHREEIDRFADAVAGAAVSFSSLCYRDLLTCWLADPEELVSAHAMAMLGHFDV